MIPIAKPIIDEKEKAKVMEVLDSGMLTQGKTTEEFENLFSGFTAARHTVACSSGTTALHLALAAAGIKTGDKVVTTPFTFIATSNSVLYCGAKPIFCDVEEDTFNMDPQSIRKTIAENPGVKAILLVHLYGNPCKMDEILQIAKDNNIVVIEDCAQAHGAYYKGRHVGTISSAGTFSFYPTKNMTTGEGGAVITNSEVLFKNCKLLREHGMSSIYEYEQIGYNYRMTNMEAAIGIAQLDKLPGFNKARAAAANFYNESLAGIDWLQTPVVEKDCVHCYHQYTLKVKARDAFAEHLKANGVGHKVFYPTLIPDSPFYKNLGYNDHGLMVARKLTQEVISIPVHPGLTEEDKEKIVATIKSFKPSVARV